MADLYQCLVAPQSMHAMLARPLGATIDDIARARRMRRSMDRTLHLSSRWLLREVLSAHLGSKEWSFERTPRGKLRLAMERNTSDIDFSLSHTRGLVVVGIDVDRKIGVDAEDPRTCGSCEALPSHVFAPPQRQSLESLSGSAHRDAFLRFWTLTEAVLKAKGTGFATDPRRIRIDSERNMALDESTGKSWSCWTWTVENTGHVLACALEGADVSPPHIHRVRLPLPNAGETLRANRTTDGLLLD